METVTQVSYSMIEKFFKILPEGRIRRRQYIGRMIGGAVALGFIGLGVIFLLMLLGLLNTITLQIFSVLVVILSYSMWYMINSKRVQDIGKNPKVVQGITLGLVIYQVGVMLLPLNQDILQLSSYVYQAIAIILFLYLLFVPGKTGDTEFGKDPINTKLGFFG